MNNSISSKPAGILISAGFAIGAAFGIAGSNVTSLILQNTLYEISSLGLITASVLVAVRLLRSGNDFLASGFLLLAVAEAVMTAGTALGSAGGQSEFAAGMALYVPALLLISIPAGLWIWVRVFGVLTAVPFAIAAFKIYGGHEVLSTSMLPGIGYGLLTLTIIGWIISVLRNKV